MCAGSWFNLRRTSSREPVRWYSPTAYTLRALCGLTVAPLGTEPPRWKNAAQRTVSFHTACRVLCLRQSVRPSNTYSRPACANNCNCNFAGRYTRRVFPVLLSRTVKRCRFTCSVVSFNTSPTRRPVANITSNTSRFVGCNAASTSPSAVGST